MPQRSPRRRRHDVFELAIVGRRITLHGDLDVVAAPRLYDAVTKVAERHGEVVLDASAVDVFGAAAVSVLYRCSQDLEPCGHLVICNPTPTVRRVLATVGLIALVRDDPDDGSLYNKALA